MQPWGTGAWAELLPLEMLLRGQGTGCAEPALPRTLPGLQRGLQAALITPSTVSAPQLQSPYLCVGGYGEGPAALRRIPHCGALRLTK